MTPATRIRLADSDREPLLVLARTYDRTLSGEIRRALRFYINNFEMADRVLRESASSHDPHAAIGVQDDP
jgi:hypothetical protein